MIQTQYDSGEKLIRHMWSHYISWGELILNNFTSTIIYTNRICICICQSRAFKTRIYAYAVGHHYRTNFPYSYISPKKKSLPSHYKSHFSFTICYIIAFSCRTLRVHACSRTVWFSRYEWGVVSFAVHWIE